MALSPCYSAQAHAVRPCRSGNPWTQSVLDVNRSWPSWGEKRWCWDVQSRLLSEPAFEWNVLTLTVNAPCGVSRAAQLSTPPKSVFMTEWRWAEDGQSCSVLSTDCYWELVCLYSTAKHNTSWLITPGCHWLLHSPSLIIRQQLESCFYFLETTNRNSVLSH